MNTLDYIVEKYKLDLNGRLPIEIPNVGRDDLARLFAELGFKSGVEIGVEEGLYSEVFCKANPQAVIYGIDPWQAYPGYREHDPASQDQDRHNQLFEAARRRLSRYYNYLIMREFSMDIVGAFKDGALDFVYIDGHHELQAVINDICEWSRKVRSGGIVAGHDYVRPQRPGTQKHVVYAVTAYTKAYNIRPWFLLGTKAVIPGEVRDKERSWMWVKK